MDLNDGIDAKGFGFLFEEELEVALVAIVWSFTTLGDVGGHNVLEFFASTA